MALGQVLFVGTDASNHKELWVTDGTAAGTSELTIAGAYSSGLFYSTNPDFTVLGSIASRGSIALFAGAGSNGEANLWVTDGTLAGTAQLTVAGQYANGLQPSNFTVLGSGALFTGYDTNGRYNLWVTDGTAAGTSELNVAGAASSLIYPYTGPDFTVLGTRALFAGDDSSNHLSLWVTDGTVAGTSEVQAAGAYGSGLFGFSLSPDLTVLGNKALFEGIDTSGHYGLWVTDGTTSGTSELTSLTEYAFGFFYYNVSPDLTVLGNSGRALFEGNDLINHFNLWVTGGTSAGTSELMVAGADPNGLFYFDNATISQSPDFTLFGTGTRALFKGEDASVKINLWISDGTSAGTAELTAVGAGSHGLFSNGAIQVSPDFTVLGGKALFAGFDANGHVNLWVTDGTSAGTGELNVAGADPSGLFFNNGSTALNPEFTVLGGQVLFDGYDVNGHVQLWTTDGTAAGTSELAAAGAYSGGLSPGDITVLRAWTPNLDLLWQIDGNSVFLQNDAGPTAVWTLSGTAFAGGGLLGNPGSSWHAKAVGDFAGNGDLDLLLQNDNGAAAIWETNASGVIGGGSLPNPGLGWQVASVGDFNGDGLSDILWQNSSGALAIWEMSGANIIGGGSVVNPGTGWLAVGTGDFNADKHADILWQNISGQVAIWEMNGTSIIGGGNVANPGISWHALGTGDFYGNGLSDILLHNDSGQVAIWEMSGTSIIGGGNVANPGPGWNVMGVGDYNSDGKSDILLQSSGGDVAIWEMNGTSIIGGGVIANPGPTWHV